MAKKKKKPEDYGWRDLLRYRYPMMETDFHTFSRPFNGDISEPFFAAVHHPLDYDPLFFIQQMPKDEFSRRKKRKIPETMFELCVDFHPGWRYLFALNPRFPDFEKKETDEDVYWFFHEDLDKLIAKCGWKSAYQRIPDPVSTPFETTKRKPEKVVGIFDYDKLLLEYGEYYEQTIVDTVYSFAKDVIWEALSCGLELKETETFLHSHYPFTSRSPHLVDLWAITKTTALFQAGLMEDTFETCKRTGFLLARPLFPLLEHFKYMDLFWSIVTYGDESEMVDETSLYWAYMEIIERTITKSLFPWQDKKALEKYNRLTQKKGQISLF